MKLYHVSPFAEIDQIQRQLNRVFNEFSGDNVSTNWSVPVELEETETQFIVRSLLPGIDRDKLDISITREQVSIAGEYTQSTPETTKYRFYSEFPHGKFRRTFSLPVPVLNSDATADYTDGILILTIPKAPEAIDKVVKLSLGDQATSEPLELEGDTTEV
ncbi:MAG: Hsp20/alpha crystallin family protein [Coleofasciculaceae cyanobacterium RL_1_1]|nr:Hsp20/alpha crystallin family protein [Coleofasciculaceae cyanobacterium RL_1_1]